MELERNEKGHALWHRRAEAKQIRPRLSVVEFHQPTNLLHRLMWLARRPVAGRGGDILAPSLLAPTYRQAEEGFLVDSGPLKHSSDKSRAGAGLGTRTPCYW